MIDIRRYSTRPETVEAAQITPANREDLALWCGGELKDGDSILVPHIDGAFKASVGDFLIKFANGRFGFKTLVDWNLSGMHEVGLRLPPLPTTIIATNSGEAYGDYPDTRYQTQDQVTNQAVARVVDEYVGDTNKIAGHSHSTPLARSAV